MDMGIHHNSEAIATLFSNVRDVQAQLTKNDELLERIFQILQQPTPIPEPFFTEVVRHQLDMVAELNLQQAEAIASIEQSLHNLVSCLPLSVEDDKEEEKALENDEVVVTVDHQDFPPSTSVFPNVGEDEDDKDNDDEDPDPRSQIQSQNSSCTSRCSKFDFLSKVERKESLKPEQELKQHQQQLKDILELAKTLAYQTHVEGRLPLHKVNILTQYRPTVHKEGYEAERPIPKRLMSYMKSKEIRRAYRHTRETLEPVSRTPVRIGAANEEERTEDTSIPQTGGGTIRAGEERMRAEEERACQIEIARLREEARLSAKEEARQILAQSSTPNHEDYQEHYDDAAQSYTSEESGEEEEETDEEESETESKGDEEESKEEEEEEEGGGEAVALSQGGTEQPRPNKHIRFTYLTPSATTLSDSGGRDTEIIETEAHTSNPNQPIQLEVASASSYISQRDTFPQGTPSQKVVTFENITDMSPNITPRSHTKEFVSSAQVMNEGVPGTGTQSGPCVEPEVTTSAYVSREAFHSLFTSMQCSLEELKLSMARVESSPSTPTLDEIRVSLAVLRAESTTNASRINILMELMATNTATLQQVVASLQRVEASTSINNQALIPLSVHVDCVTQNAMNALGDRLLQKVADFIADFNSKATTEAKNINDTLARFNYRLDDEVQRVVVVVNELLKTIEEVIRSMSRVEDERPKRQRDQSPCAEPPKRRRLDDDEDPDESRPQTHQEGENLPTATPSTTPLAVPSAPSSSTLRHQSQPRQSKQSQQVPDNAEALRKGKMPMTSEAEPAMPHKSTEVIDLLSTYGSEDSDLALSSSTEYAMDMVASSTTQQEEEVVAVNVADPSLLHILVAIPLEEVTVAAPPPHSRTD
ncbi:probable serine/threonine-protein kinase kinX [Cynara cardunculus var. scolymus]|uniref:probable serine/threonine-protein kinase kinX n=1 Tax=Cynara cardunculus var. scolymus TaxID=59895 RepID=UPI000D62AF32|nr:probable serine/threonine-protein kinase kinX [Cynara cardunculus var. scolymus]